MPDPKMFLNITGTVTADASGGYTRFTVSGPMAGPLARFVGVETSQIQPGSVANASAGGSAHAAVPILSRLAISDYPLPPPLDLASIAGTHLSPTGQTVAPPVTVAGLNPTLTHGVHLLGYHLTDGTALTVADEDGQVVGLSGKSADQHSYALSTSLTTVQAAGRQGAHPKVTWLVANLRITKDSAKPFTFGFSYAPEAFLFNVHSFCGNVTNSILVDLAASVVVKQTGNLDGTASLTRYLQYYGDTYSSQNLVVPATTVDAQFHLPNQATLWPFLSDVALFSDALAQIGGNPPQLAQSPFVALGSLDDLEVPANVAAVSERFTSSIVPSFGPLAVSCLSSDDSAIGLKAAVIWLVDLLLTTGTGKAAVQAAAQAYYNNVYNNRFADSPAGIGPMPGPDIKPDPVMMDG